MSTRIKRLLGQSTLGRDIRESKEATAAAEAAELAALEEARIEDAEATELSEAMEGDLTKLVKKLSNSSPNDLKAAAKMAKEMGDDLSNSMSERPIWKALATMLKTAAK